VTPENSLPPESPDVLLPLLYIESSVKQIVLPLLLALVLGLAFLSLPAIRSHLPWNPASPADQSSTTSVGPVTTPNPDPQPQAVSATAPSAQVAPSLPPTLPGPPATRPVGLARFSETVLSPYRKNVSGGFTPHWVAYILNAEGSTRDRPQFNVQLNGQLLGPYENLSRMFASSRDGRHIAFAAKRGDGWRIIVDGVEKWAHPDLFWSTSTWATDLEGKSVAMQTPAATLGFSPDGASLSYAARTASGNYAVMIDGRPGPEFTSIGSDIKFVGGTVTYAAWPDRNKIVRVYGEKVLGPYDSATRASISADGRHMAMPARNGDRNLLVVDGIEREAPGPVVQVEVAANGQIAYSYQAGNKMRLRLGETDLPGEFDQITRPVISPDSKTVAYWARNGADWSLKAAGRDYAGFDGYYYYLCGTEECSIMWGPDSEHVAYYCRDGGDATMALDGQKLAQAYPPKGFTYTVFSDESKHAVGAGLVQSPGFDRQAVVQALAMRIANVDPFGAAMLNQQLCYSQTRDGSAFMNVGVRREGPYREIRGPLLTSPSGGHYAYIIETDKGQQLVVDGHPAGHDYDAIYLPTFSDTGDSLTFLAVRDGNLLCVALAANGSEAQRDPASRSNKSGTKPTTELLTANELALDPGSAGFHQIGAIVTNGLDGKELSRVQQWKRKNADGSDEILSISQADGKITGATLKEVKE
jgi:hypothetical protein